MKPGRLSELLSARAGAPAGGPADLLLESWREVEDLVLADGHEAREALSAAAEGLPPMAGALADRRSLAAAVLTISGAVCFADAGFRALFPDYADLRPLLRRALREGPLVSLVEGAAGAAFIAWIGPAAAAARWPLEAEAAAALGAGTDRLAVLVSAPSRSSELARRAACALDLTALEARLAEALLFAPNLEVAAAEAGVGRETARDALRRLNAKAGVRRTPELIGRLIGLMCAAGAAPGSAEEVAATVFGLTAAEARVAVLVAEGATVPGAAEALGVSPETVKSHVKAIFAKTGAKGGKDLARLLQEARQLVALADASEPVFEDPAGGRLRVVASLDGDRRVAVIDYGPYDGEPVFVFHGAAAGRRLPEGFRRSLAARGLRALVVQRPGFGLTDPAHDHAKGGADDLAAVAERLKLRRVHMLARDTGAPVALAFAVAHPALLGRAVLLNPHHPLSLGDDRTTFAAAVQRRLLRNPELLGVFAEFLRRQTTTPMLQRIVRKTLADVDVDRQALEDPAVLDFLVRDIQALCARSIRGFTAEHALFALGWEPPAGPVMADGGWTIGLSGELPGHVEPTWLPVAAPRLVMIEGAGLLPQFTHPDELAALVQP